MKLSEHQQHLAIGYTFFLIVAMVLGSVAAGMFFGARWGVLAAAVCVAWLAFKVVMALAKELREDDDGR